MSNDKLNETIDSLSKEQKEAIAELLNSTKSEIKEMLKESNISSIEADKDSVTISNKTEKKLPDVVLQKSDPNKGDSEPNTTYTESKYKIERTGEMNPNADTSIYQSIMPDRERNESTVVPDKLIKNPLTENRGGVQTEGDTLNHRIQVTNTFYDPNTRCNAEAKYNKEGGRIKHGTNAPMVSSGNIKEGGQVAKGFNPNTVSDMQKIPFKYMMTGFSVMLDNQEIHVNQGFHELDQAKASIDENIFMIHHNGKMRISKLFEGTPIILQKDGSTVSTYNNNVWKD